MKPRSPTDDQGGSEKVPHLRCSTRCRHKLAIGSGADGVSTISVSASALGALLKNSSLRRWKRTSTLETANDTPFSVNLDGLGTYRIRYCFISVKCSWSYTATATHGIVEEYCIELVLGEDRMFADQVTNTRYNHDETTILGI